MKKINQKTKSVIRRIIFVLLFFIMLDFIPIKIAKTNNITVDDNVVICEVDYKSGILEEHWVMHEQYSIIHFTEVSVNPFQVLSEKYFDEFDVFCTDQCILCFMEIQLEKKLKMTNL